MSEKHYDPTLENTLNACCAELKKALGDEWVSDDPVTNICYSRDQSIVRAKRPNMVCMPASTDQVADVVRIARRFGVPLTPYSTGINSGGGCIPEKGGIILDMRRMDRILEIDETNMTMRVQPFVSFGWGQCEAQKIGMRLCNPTAPPTPSILSNFLDKGIGLSSAKYGLGVDHIVNMTVVLPDGDILKTGSGACPGAGSVNVGGPGPELGGMFESSYGMFGVVTEMTVQLYHWPRYEYFTGITDGHEDLETVLEIMRELMREDITEELFLFQDAYLAIGAAENNDGAEVLKKYAPRNALILYLAGWTEEEVEIKKRQLDRFVKRLDLTYLPDAFMEMYDKALDARKCLKITQYTPRAERLRGSFLIFWFNTTLGNLPPIARLYQRMIKEELADTDPRSSRDPFPRECPAIYVQPVEFARYCGVEMDVFWSPEDPESVKRTLPLAPAFIEAVLDLGGWYERTLHFGVWQSPRLGTYFPLLCEMKAKLDPGNIMNPGRVGLPK
ncbi:MAG: FAD-binding oxidoreductase [bacterium]